MLNDYNKAKENNNKYNNKFELYIIPEICLEEIDNNKFVSL